jgi:hypothetical protein
MSQSHLYAADSYIAKTITDKDETDRMMKAKVSEIATLLGGTYDHYKSDDCFVNWLSAHIYLPNGIGIYFRSNGSSSAKPVFEISIDWSISVKNGAAIWDRIGYLKDSKTSTTINIYHQYGKLGDIQNINISALKSSDRVAKEIKSRLLTDATDLTFNNHLEKWIDNATYVYNNKNKLRTIAGLVKSKYEIDLDRVTSDALAFSGEGYQHVKITTSSDDRLNLSISQLTEDQLMAILKIANLLK